MSEQGIHKVLKNFFSKSGKEVWEKTAAQEIGEKSPLEKLSWRGKDKIFYLPYYDAEDVAHLRYLEGFRLPAADHPFGPRRWANLPAVIVRDDASANASALTHLSFGADGILFLLENIQQVDFSRLLHRFPSQATVAFRVGGNADHLIPPLGDLFEKNLLTENVRGALFWESIPKNIRAFGHFKNFCNFGLIIPHTSPADEISDALIRGVLTIERIAGDTDSREAIRSIGFSLASDASLLESAAKLKVLRLLWYQVVHAYGHNDFKTADLLLHVRSPRAADGQFGPHENMLKATFTALAAITGGCDMLTVECDEEPLLAVRQARNISTILREESFLNQVADPFAGAYAFDSIVNAMAGEAWSMFQKKCGQS